MASYLFIASIVIGWSILAAVICLSLCMMSSRFSAEVDRHERDRQAARAAAAAARRVPQSIAVRAMADAGSEARSTSAAARF